MTRFDRVSRVEALALTFELTDAPVMRDEVGVGFVPDHAELRYAKLAGSVWRLNLVEISGPGVNLAGNFFRVRVYAMGHVLVPEWFWEFVRAIDVDEELKG